MTSRRTGLTILELLVTLGILCLLLVPVMTLFRRHQEEMALRLACERVISALQLARHYATSENRTFSVTFGEREFTILREGTELVGKSYHLPEHVLVRSKTDGFNPVVFLPDGTSREAGHIVLGLARDARKARKILLYNLTGRCFIEE